jgi:hypothetical protein
MQISRFRPSTFIACGPFAAQSFGLLLALLLPLQSPAVPQTKLDQSVIQAEHERLSRYLWGLPIDSRIAVFVLGARVKTPAETTGFSLGFRDIPSGMVGTLHVPL